MYELHKNVLTAFRDSAKVPSMTVQAATWNLRPVALISAVFASLSFPKHFSRMAVGRWGGSRQFGMAQPGCRRAVPLKISVASSESVAGNEGTMFALELNEKLHGRGRPPAASG